MRRVNNYALLETWNGRRGLVQVKLEIIESLYGMMSTEKIRFLGDLVLIVYDVQKFKDISSKKEDDKDPINVQITTELTQEERVMIEVYFGILWIVSNAYKAALASDILYIAC